MIILILYMFFNFSYAMNNNNNNNDDDNDNDNERLECDFSNEKDNPSNAENLPTLNAHNLSTLNNENQTSNAERISIEDNATLKNLNNKINEASIERNFEASDKFALQYAQRCEQIGKAQNNDKYLTAATNKCRFVYTLTNDNELKQTACDLAAEINLHLAKQNFEKYEDLKKKQQYINSQNYLTLAYFYGGEFVYLFSSQFHLNFKIRPNISSDPKKLQDFLNTLLNEVKNRTI